MIQPGQIVTQEMAAEALKLQAHGVLFQARDVGETGWTNNDSWRFTSFHDMEYRRAPEKDFKWETGKCYLMEGGGVAEVVNGADQADMKCCLLSEGPNKAVKSNRTYRIEYDGLQEFYYENGKFASAVPPDDLHLLSLTQVECDRSGHPVNSDRKVDPGAFLRFAIEMAIDRITHKTDAGNTISISLRGTNGTVGIRKEDFVSEIAKAIESQEILQQHLETLRATEAV